MKFVDLITLHMQVFTLMRRILSIHCFKKYTDAVTYLRDGGLQQAVYDQHIY